MTRGKRGHATRENPKGNRAFSHKRSGGGGGVPFLHALRPLRGAWLREAIFLPALKTATKKRIVAERLINLAFRKHEKTWLQLAGGHLSLAVFNLRYESDESIVYAGGGGGGRATNLASKASGISVEGSLSLSLP